MKTLGYNQPLYILPFDHRGSFETKRFGWHGDLTPAQTTEFAAGAPKEQVGVFENARPA